MMRNLLKRFLFLFLIWALAPAWAQGNSDLILYGTKELEWKDFKGKPDNGSGFDALTYAQMEAPNSWDQDSLHLEITAKFVRSQSWAKKIGSDALLKHEKLHFDITEYHTRLFRKAILNYRFSSYDKVGDEVATLFYKYHKKAMDMQERYDHASNHSKNEVAQEKWNKKVALLMNKTAAYNQIKIDLYIGYLK